MGLLGRTTLAASAATLLLAYPSVTALASKTELIRIDEASPYTVQPGDSLWTIAERQLGDAYRYPELADLNSGIISDPDRIYPDMTLLLPAERIWLVNNELQMPMGDYSFAVPFGMHVSCLSPSPAKYAQDGGASANFTLTDTDGVNFIACLVQDRDDRLAQSISDWESCCQTIRSYAAAEYRDTVSELSFEHYRTLTGEDVCLFSYVYRLDLAQYGHPIAIPIDVCMGIHLTDHMQAQFLGVSIDADDMRSQVRIAAGSFTELAAPDAPLAETDNMAILPAYSWEVSGMFDPFPWVAQFYDETSREAFDIPAEQSLRDRFLHNTEKP